MTPRRMIPVALAALLLVAQAIPIPPAENPPVGQELQAPAEVMTVLRTSCYDCHSNETVWPWYSHVIPSKWFVRQHVVEGRGHLNFSTWGEYPARRAAHKLEEVVELVEEGEMPLASYLWLHAEAGLSEEDADRIIDWARSLGTELEAGLEEEGNGSPP
jgi:hypothetical protein